MIIPTYLILAIPVLPFAISQAFLTRMQMFLFKTTWLVIFIPLIIGMVKYQKFSQELKIIFYYIAFGALIEVLNKTAVYIIGLQNSMPLGHFYIFGAFLLAGLFYSRILESYLKKKVVIVIIILFELFVVLNIIFIQSPYSFPSIPGAVAAIILVVFSIMLFVKIMEDGKIRKLSSDPVVWINSAVLIYYTSNFFYYILFNIILQYSREFSISTIQLLHLSNVIFYSLIAVGFMKVSTNRAKS